MKHLFYTLSCMFTFIMCAVFSAQAAEDPEYIIVSAEHQGIEGNPDYLDYRPSMQGIGLNMWEGTCSGSAITEGVYEGGSSTRITVNPGWFGFGFASASDQLDVSMFSREDYTLHFAIRTTAAMELFIQMDAPGTPNNAKVYLKNRYAFARDGEWHRVEIPMSAFLSQGIDWSGNLNLNNNFFSLVSSSVSGGEVIDFDYVYFYKNEPETPRAQSEDKPGYAKYVLVATEHTDTDANTDYLDIRPNGGTCQMNVWENTVTGIEATGAPFEGSTYTNLKVNQAWFGIGFVSTEAVDFSTFAHKDFILHFAIKTTSDMPLFVRLDGEVGTGIYSLDFARDGDWHLIEIPMSQFYRQGMIWDFSLSGINYFALVSESAEMNAEIGIDHVMFYAGKRDYDNGGGSVPIPNTPDYVLVAAEHEGIEGNPDYLDLRPGNDGRRMDIWEGTATGAEITEDPYEGGSYTQITTSGSTWWGLGFVSDQPINFKPFSYAGYKLHFAIKTTSAMPMFVKLEGEAGSSAISFLDFERDGEWQVIEIPMDNFFSQGLIWNGPITLRNYFTLVCEANEAGAVVGFDDVQFIKTSEPEEPGTGTNNVKTEKLAIYQQGDMLYIDGLDGKTTVDIISISGSVIMKTTNSEIYTGNLNKGLYIVKAGAKTAKIIVR